MLQNLDLKIERGERIADCSTGSGKSTLVDLLMGLLYPSTGRWLIDGSTYTILTTQSICLDGGQ